MTSPDEARKDLLAGVFFTSFGAIGLWGAQELTFGKVDAMGPGFFPSVVSGLLCCTGLLLVLRGVCLGGVHRRTSGFPVGIPLLLILALVGFAFLAEPFGMLPASFFLVFVSRLAAGDGRWGEALLLALVLSICSSLLFIGILALPFPLWGDVWGSLFMGLPDV